GDGLGQIERSSQPKLNRRGRSSEPCSSAKAESRAKWARQGGIAIRNPNRRLMARPHLVHDAGGARIVRLMHDRVLAVENPVIRIRPFDPNAGFVAGDNLSGANSGLRLLGFDLEPRMRADEHVHERALAHSEPESLSA